MSNILTPVSLWKNFKDDLDIMPVTLGEKVEDGVKYEYVNFSGRDTDMGRVTVYGVLASAENNPARECLLVLCDSCDEPDEKLLAFFVSHGYSALCVDYAGKFEDRERYTQYPQNVGYANLSECGRHKDYVDGTAFDTCWYEWVAVGVYARKFLIERFGSKNVGLVGLRDGGEIAWKLSSVVPFSCAVMVSACGWDAYKGYSKFEGVEPEFDEERYRFVAGIDSQAYAPYVKCPVLLLCSTNDPSFDYDRAYDTFSRINPDFANLSSISYSINCDTKIDYKSTHDMFMFLDSNVKDRQVFMPKPAEITVCADETGNLIAHASFDRMGIIDKCGVYISEDCYDSVSRDWAAAPFKRAVSEYECEFYLNVYEKTNVVFVVAFVTYSNGFTVWSKLAMKKIGGKFRNSRTKSKIMYSNKFGANCFSVGECDDIAIGKMFLKDDDILPKMITLNGLEGIYSQCGLTTTRIKSPQFAPNTDSILKFDVTSQENTQFEVSVVTRSEDEVYSVKLNVIGGVWQSEILEAKLFKNELGVSLTDFTDCKELKFECGLRYAVNNLIWL